MNYIEGQGVRECEESVVNDCKQHFAYKTSDNPSKILKNETVQHNGEVKIIRIYQNCISCDQCHLNQRPYLHNNLFCEGCYKDKFIPLKKKMEKNRSHQNYDVMNDLLKRFKYRDYYPKDLPIHSLPSPFIVSKL